MNIFRTRLFGALGTVNPKALLEKPEVPFSLSAVSHEIAIEKGFWNEVLQAYNVYQPFIAEVYLERHVWKQLGHLTDEIEEFVAAQTATQGEELADVLIVLADLVVVLGYDITSEQIVKGVCDSSAHAFGLFRVVAKMDHVYRKKGTIPQNLVNLMVKRLCAVADCVGVDLLAEFKSKCEKNLGRVPNYGTTLEKAK